MNLNEIYLKVEHTLETQFEFAAELCTPWPDLQADTGSHMTQQLFDLTGVIGLRN